MSLVALPPTAKRGSVAAMPVAAVQVPPSQCAATPPGPTVHTSLVEAPHTPRSSPMPAVGGSAVQLAPS